MVYDYFPALLARRKGLAGYCSGGELQMLVIGRALMAHPMLLLLDEPSLGLAPLLVKEIFQIIRRINQEQGTTLMVVEQNANMALQIANYGYVMENGRIVLDAPGYFQYVKSIDQICHLQTFYFRCYPKAQKSRAAQLIVLPASSVAVTFH